MSIGYPTKAYLIFNPASGHAIADLDLEMIQAKLQSRFDLSVHLTSMATGAKELAQNALAQGVKHIIAAGGDGTLSQVAGVVSGTDATLGVIPLGTENALARALQIPTLPEAACNLILNGKVDYVDIAWCDRQPMLSSVNIGYEADVLAKADDAEAKSRWGRWAYGMAHLQTLRHHLSRFTVVLDADGRQITIAASAITIANAAPPSSMLAQGCSELLPNDGLLDITIVSFRSLPDAIATAFHLWRSALNKVAARRGNIFYLKAQRIKVRTEPPQQVAVDGTLTGQTPIEVCCEPQRLRVIKPST